MNLKEWHIWDFPDNIYVLIKPMLTLDLCEKLLLTVSGIYHHLRYLENEGLIKRTGYNNKLVWKIKGQGLVHEIS